MAYSIRAFRENDASELAALTVAAIQAVGSTRYSEKQVTAWAARHTRAERFAERAADGAHIFVLADANDSAVAYALLEPDGHLDMLYCHPDHTRKGLADQLLAHSEHQARALGISRLYTEASELARPAFERTGYEVQRRRDFEIEGPNGPVPIHNYAMEKRLA